MVMLRNKERIKQVKELSSYCSFMMLESALGMVDEVDETNDTFARDNFLRFERYHERLERIKSDYDSTHYSKI